MQVELDGESLTPAVLYQIGYGNPLPQVSLSDSTWRRIEKSRQVVLDILQKKQVVYGINTGFGKFSDVIIPDDKLALLQTNLIRSHAAGVGEPISHAQTRMLLALRINVLAKGHSGISPENLRKLVKALNTNVVSVVPCKGTVGASGDLAPLSHLVLGMLGDGLMWDPEDMQQKPAQVLLEKYKLEKLDLGPKEGLALINGTQFITALGCEAVIRAQRIAKQADIVTALSLEVLKGTAKAFNPLIHQARPHPGQIESAARIRSVLHHSRHNPSEIALSHKNCGAVQDSYTLRCVPQVHGVVHDTIDFVLKVLERECNSATDNPMIFANVPVENEFGEEVISDMLISGGNFHGEYPAKVLDYLAIGIHEISNISERRIERLVNPMLSNLPGFLVNSGGLNSGLMIAHCTAASLVSENKTLCHPASVDSLSTSAAKEDHVSMGGWAARKALVVVDNVEHVLAIELLAACQGLEFHRPLTTTEPLEKVFRLVRSRVEHLEQDRYIAPDILKCVEILRQGLVGDAVALK